MDILTSVCDTWNEFLGSVNGSGFQVCWPQFDLQDPRGERKNWRSVAVLWPPHTHTIAQRSKWIKHLSEVLNFRDNSRRPLNEEDRFEMLQWGSGPESRGDNRALVPCLCVSLFLPTIPKQSSKHVCNTRDSWGFPHCRLWSSVVGATCGKTPVPSLPSWCSSLREERVSSICIHSFGARGVTRW